MASTISHKPKKTFTVARNLGAGLVRGDVIALAGELGAGKTHFVKGLVAGCGSADRVTSPTFTILHEYRGGRLPVFHFDFYRLEHRAEVERLGFEEYLEDGGGLAVIEWADRFPELLPERTRWIDLAAGTANERTISEASR
jgi:tRNA threonylcarbamoyladenosine biosynthesis protein TsaE